MSKFFNCTLKICVFNKALLAKIHTKRLTVFKVTIIRQRVDFSTETMEYRKQ